MHVERLSHPPQTADGAGGLALSGCDPLSRSKDFHGLLRGGEALTMSAQRALMAGQPLAREFSERDISRIFKANGTKDPGTPEYQAHADAAFSNWRLRIDGLVEQSQSLSLKDIRALPARSQITRHDCVEGWSAIGKWTGAQLGLVLQAAGLKPNARFAVFHCADNYGGGEDMYYESIDLIDAFHAQTILAYEMNGQVLPVAHGAPLRLRVERQLGYKHAKYVARIEAVADFKHLHRGKGGYWEDRGYEWYAGI